ncbi:MAG: rhodanese-like domain-containing protein [Clostridia bacterium]|nr:rhodanese-like domain-containing protein [Clostridia bacterium]
MEYKRGFENSEPEEFSRMMREPHILIDVRTVEEYEEEHILNAINIPLDELADFIETLREQCRDKAVLVYCATGARSAAACDMLYRSGYIYLYNLLGGIKAWKRVYRI